MGQGNDLPVPWGKTQLAQWGCSDLDLLNSRRKSKQPAAAWIGAARPGVSIWLNAQILAPPRSLDHAACPLSAPFHSPSTPPTFSSALKSPCTGWPRLAQVWLILQSLQCAWVDAAACVGPVSVALTWACLMAHLLPHRANTDHMHQTKGSLGWRPQLHTNCSTNYLRVLLWSTLVSVDEKYTVVYNNLCW